MPSRINANPTAKLIFHHLHGTFWGSFGEGCARELGTSHSCDGIDINAHRHYANLRSDNGTMTDWLDHDLFKIYARNIGTEWHPSYDEPLVLVAFLGQGPAPIVNIYPAAKDEGIKTVCYGPVVVFSGWRILSEILDYPAEDPKGSIEDFWKSHIKARAQVECPNYGF